MVYIHRCIPNRSRSVCEAKIMGFLGCPAGALPTREACLSADFAGHRNTQELGPAVSMGIAVLGCVLVVSVCSSMLNPIALFLIYIFHNLIA